MGKYVGTPLRHGIVAHDLNTMDLTDVTLWHLNSDGSRTLYVAAVDVLDENLIRVERHATGTCGGNFALDCPQEWRVVITS